MIGYSQTSQVYAEVDMESRSGSSQRPPLVIRRVTRVVFGVMSFVLVAVAGIVGFATVGLAACGHDLDVADTSSTTVASASSVSPVRRGRRARLRTPYSQSSSIV